MTTRKQEQAVPHNLEAERALLACVLHENSALQLIRERLWIRDFFSEAHRLIFVAMIAISKEKRSINLLTLSKQLAKEGEFQKAGGAAYLTMLTEGVPLVSPLAVSEYSGMVRDKSILRRLSKP